MKVNTKKRYTLIKNKFRLNFHVKSKGLVFKLIKKKIS